MHRGRVALVLAVAGALGACGERTPISETFSAAREVLRSEGPDASPAALTRAQLAGFDQPLLRATVENRGAVALLGPISTSATGERIWQTADGITLTLRRGVIVATRGLGEDLMSAAGGRAGATLRTHYTIAGTEQTRATRLDCATASVAAPVTVLGQRHATRRITETCTATVQPRLASGTGLLGGVLALAPPADPAPQQIVNTFWVDSGGTLRKSRQWVSNSVGYITIERLIDG